MRRGIKNAFTLIEVLVVIAVIAVITSIIAIKSFKTIDKSRVVTVIEDFRAIKAAAISYYADTGHWPANDNNSSFLTNDGNSGWSGPYLEKWPKLDTWSGSYGWRNVNDNERYVDISGVPSGAARKIDADLDDGNGTSGVVRYYSSNSMLRVAVTND